jgi:hypothetical protein
MPPLASSSSSDSADSNFSFEAVGFEIEAEEMQNGSLVVSNIVGLPAEVDSEHDVAIDKAISMDDGISINRNNSIDASFLPSLQEEDEEEEGDSFYTAMENAFTSLTMCVDFDPDCHCKPLKSALKDPNRPIHSIDRQVSFTKLKIREYDMTLGDHPSARSGPPVQLDWDYKAENVVNLEDYERARQPRRNRRQMRLTYRDRERLLYKEKGFTEEEVNSAWLEALTIRKQRNETVKQTEAQKKWEEAWESAQRKAARMFNVYDDTVHTTTTY